MRDEHGMEPLDSLFSSPEKTKAVGNAIDEEDEDDDDDSDEGMAMDIDHSMLPAPPTRFTYTKSCW